jgi:ornithine cyclodeaminase
VNEGHVLGEIGDVLSGTVVGRTGDDNVTVYKSLGVAAQDLAAAHVIYERAVRDGIGTRAPF